MSLADAHGLGAGENRVGSLAMVLEGGKAQ